MWTCEAGKLINVPSWGKKILTGKADFTKNLLKNYVFEFAISKLCIMCVLLNELFLRQAKYA